MYRIAPGYEISWSTKFRKSILRCRAVLSWGDNWVEGVGLHQAFLGFSGYKLG
jgi:hypothetical protein